MCPVNGVSGLAYIRIEEIAAGVERDARLA